MSVASQIKEKISSASRRRKVRSFYQLFGQGMSVLDVGVSAEQSGEYSAENYFLKTYPYESSTYTGLGIQDLGQMTEKYPGKRFVCYPGGRFPFRDKEFDWIFCNAVIEHVGNGEAQLEFVREMLRVGKGCFFTTPNKYFPIETHTNVLFLHWCESAFLQWCSKRHLWVSKYNPYLFSFGRLKQLLAGSGASHYSISQSGLWGMAMTFTVVCRD